MPKSLRGGNITTDPGYEFGEEALAAYAEISKDDPKKMAISTSRIAMAGIVRQGAASKKSATDITGSNRGISFKGWPWRALGMAPGFLASEEFAKTESNSTVKNTFAAASAETVFRGYTDVKSMQSRILSLTGKSIERRIGAAATAAMPYLWGRACANWIAATMPIEIDDETNALMARAIGGFFSGIISALPDSMANIAVAHVARDESGLGSFSIAGRAIKNTMKEVVGDFANFAKRSISNGLWLSCNW